MMKFLSTVGILIMLFFFIIPENPSPPMGMMENPMKKRQSP
jgi:hypothetical protein